VLAEQKGLSSPRGIHLHPLCVHKCQDQDEADCIPMASFPLPLMA
jgi:hypothetical protein